MPVVLERYGEEITTKLVPEYDPDEDRRMIGILMNQLGVMVTYIEPGSPAEEADIKIDDVILVADGKRIYDVDDLSEAINSAEEGQKVTLFLQRGTEGISIDDLVPESDGGELSIGVDGIYADTYPGSERYPFFQAIAKGGEYFIKMPSMIVDAISAMDGDYSDAVVGPVGVVQITGETTKYGFGATIGLAGLISFGIGLFNLFPIPPLDGGTILISGVEGIRRGKRLSPRAMQLTYAIGAALLFTLFIMITYNDIVRLIRGDNILP